MTECIKEYILEQTGCELDWLTTSLKNLQQCKTIAEIKTYAQVMAKLQSITYSDIKDRTGIYIYFQSDQSFFEKNVQKTVETVQFVSLEVQ